MKRLGGILLKAVFAASLFTSAASAAIIVYSYEDLLQDAAIKKMAMPFMAISSANVVYAQCISTFSLTPKQIEFQQETFKDTSQDYLKAFHDAYTKRVHAEPEKPIVDGYVGYIKAQQQLAVDRTVLTIQQRTCAHTEIIKIVKYVEKLHYASDVAKANEDAKLAAKRASVPVSPMDSKPVVTQPINPNSGGGDNAGGSNATPIQIPAGN